MALKMYNQHLQVNAQGRGRNGVFNEVPLKSPPSDYDRRPALSACAYLKWLSRLLSATQVHRWSTKSSMTCRDNTTLAQQIFSTQMAAKNLRGFNEEVCLKYNILKTGVESLSGS